MKVCTKILAIATIVCLFFLLVCGLWIGANGADAEGAAFHSTLGIVSVALGMGTSVLALVLAGKKKELRVKN